MSAAYLQLFDAFLSENKELILSLVRELWPPNPEIEKDEFESDEEAWIRSAFNGSIDSARNFVNKVLPFPSIVEINWDPSGCGATIVYYPEGLSSGKEVKGNGYAYTPEEALVEAAVSVLVQIELGLIVAPGNG